LPPSRFDVLVCGSLHLDVIVRTPRLPRSDETVVGTSWSQICGGKGGNQAVQAARQGAKVAMIGRIGSDDFGARLLANLDSAGVDRSAVETDAAAGSGMSVAMLDAKGDYGAVIVSGSNLGIPPAGIAATWLRLGGAKVLVLQNEVPHAANVASARTAKAEGAIVLLNAAPARPSGSDLLDLIDVLVVNRIEAEMISGVAVKDRAGAIAALPALGADRRTVIVTLGSGGLVVAAPGEAPCEIAALPVAVVSTHGAGDCFVGALASRLAQGDGMIAACRVANAAAGNFVAGNRAPRPDA
jgi:ribokinase